AQAAYRIQSFAPTLALSPNSGNPPGQGVAGTTVTANGTGFAANELVYILFNTNVTGTGWVTVAQVVARQVPRTTTVAYVTRFEVPPATGNTAAVYALGGTSGAQSPPFTFHLATPSIGVVPNTGNPGTE